MFAVALAFVFFPHQIARGAVLFNRFILRRDISDAQSALERKTRLAGWVALAVYAVWLLYEILPLMHKN